MTTEYERVKKWRDANPDKRRESNRRCLLRRYGLTEETYDRLLEGQGGRCAICRSNKARGTSDRFQVDHDHRCCPGSRSCGRCVRGLLCNGCNSGLGKFDDDYERLQLAAQYLKGASNGTP